MLPISTENAPAAVGPYSQAIAVNGLLFVSGQLPIDPKSGEFNSDNMIGQMEQCMANIQAIAIAAGTSIARTVKTTILLTDISQFAQINEVYGRFFTSPYPARACYEVSALPRGARVRTLALLSRISHPAGTLSSRYPDGCLPV